MMQRRSGDSVPNPVFSSGGQFRSKPSVTIQEGSVASSRVIRRAVLCAAVACAIILIFVLTACKGGGAGGGDTIKVGVVLPTTGREAKPGQYQKEGIELAIKQINDAGGVNVGGKKLKLQEVFYDDSSDQAKSASLVERAMSSDHVTAVLGGYSTALGEAESVMP